VIKYGFNVKKSAQAASILLKLNGGDMGKYVFIKMLYLSDRESFKRWGAPITGDDAVSMEHGPVLSNIYNLTKGDCPLYQSEWEPFISPADVETNRVSNVGNPGEDELSPAEIKILRGIHAEFKNFTWKQMKDFCHEFEEYDGTVGKSSRPIATEKILQAIGKTPEEIQEKEQDLKEVKMLRLLFG